MPASVPTTRFTLIRHLRPTRVLSDLHSAPQPCPACMPAIHVLTPLLLLRWGHTVSIGTAVISSICLAHLLIGTKRTHYIPDRTVHHTNMATAGTLVIAAKRYHVSLGKPSHVLSEGAMSLSTASSRLLRSVGALPLSHSSSQRRLSDGAPYPSASSSHRLLHMMFSARSPLAPSAQLPW